MGEFKLKYFDDQQLLKKEYYDEITYQYLGQEYHSKDLNTDAITNRVDAELFLEEINECNKYARSYISHANYIRTIYLTTSRTYSISAKACPQDITLAQGRNNNINIKDQNSIFEILIVLMKDYVDNSNKFFGIRCSLLWESKLILSVINHLNKKLDTEIVDLILNYISSISNDRYLKKLTINCLKKHCGEEDKLKLELLYGGV